MVAQPVPAPPEDLDHICLSDRAQAGDWDTCRRAVQRIAAVDAPDGDAAAAAAVERLDALDDRIACYHGADRLAACVVSCGDDSSGLGHDDSSTPAGHSGALDGGPDRPVFAADPAAGAHSGGRRRAGAQPPYRERRPAGHGAGTGADLHHLPSSAQPQHMVRCRSGPAPAWAAGGGVRAERAGCGRPG
jgi:hypothetical protein